MAGEMTTTVSVSEYERALIMGDLSKLSAQAREAYYLRTCESLGLNHLTRPFEYITLNGKLTLYARKDCTDQLRRLHGVSIDGVDIRFEGDSIIVTAKGRDKSGRCDTDIGVVSKRDMRGDVGNCVMKAVTKAKRRLTLSLCGLGMLDESEVESIPDAKPAPAPQVTVTGATADNPGDPPKRGQAAAPKSGKELHERLTRKQSELEGRGVIPEGGDVLVEHVITCGVEQGYPSDMGQWDGPMAKAGYAWALDLVRNLNHNATSKAAAANVQE